ncbi:CipA protein [Fusarium acuminatum]|uniref:CipA protein n=1 Tax=Fusarium acuminatum TaxID=5515 RepID=A0ABZ2X1H3_9HYPO
MAQQYANQRPKGFVNHIRAVAIVGASGRVGHAFTSQLLQTGKHTVTAITRVGSSSAFPEGVKVASVDYSNQGSLVSALKGQDMLVITLSLNAPPDTHTKLVKAAAEAGVPYVVPNVHSINFWDSKALREDLPVGNNILANIAEVKEHGLVSLSMFEGFWYEHSLPFGPITFGIDFTNRTALLYDDGKKAINISTWVQIGRALAALASLRRLPEDDKDDSLSLAHFHDRPVFVSSFKISQADVLESVKRVTGTSEKDWQVSYQSSEDRYKEGQKELEQGNQLGFYKSLHARVFYPSGDADFEPDNQLLGLPEEDLDEATKRALELVEKSS